MKYSSAALMAALALGITVPSFAADSTQNQGINQNEFYNVNYDFDSPSVTLGKQSSPYIIFKLPTKDGEIIRYLRLNQGGYLIDIPEISLNSVEINGTEASNYNYDKTVIDTSKKYTPGETVVGNVIVTIPSDGSVGSGGTYDLESMVITGSVDGPDMPETPWHPTVDTTPIKVTNVAAGAITKDSTDAITGGQLFNALNNLDTTLTNKGLNFTADKGNYHSNLGDTVSVNGDAKNISTEFTNNSVKIKLADDLNVNSVTAKTVTADTGKFKNLTADKGNITELTANTIDAKTVTADTGKFKNLTADKGNITELTANTIDAKTVIADTGKFKNLSADKANISDLTVNTIQLGNGETYLTPDGLDANGHKIINVADGTERTDAVNYGQLDDRISSDGKTVTVFAKDTANTIDVRGTDVDGNRIDRVITGINTDANDTTSAANVGYVNNTATVLSNKMDSGFAKLGQQVKNVGANAAALAALHPQDFDADYKFSVAAGVGNYKGKNGTAIGAFYRPNEDLMFSVGGTFGDDAMVNAGISYKFGHSSKKDNKSEELESLKKQVILLSNQVAKLQKDNSKFNLSNIKQSFPDVPSDHWAKEAVDTLHGNEVLEGYPDGEFKGDQKMSRYEYAQMLYKAARK